MKDDRHGNRVTHGPHRADPHPPTVRKVDRGAVPYGSDISLNGKTVWAAYDADGRLVCVAATSSEVRRTYREIVMH